MDSGRARPWIDRWLRGSGGRAICATIIAPALIALWPQTSQAASASWSAPVHIAGGELNGVSCPSSSFCAAVGEDGQAFTYNGGSWSSGTTIDGTNDLRAVSCPTGSFCAAVGDAGQIVTFDGTSWGTPVQLSPPVNLTSVSCPIASFCVAAGEDYLGGGGTSTIYNGATWTGPTPLEQSFGALLSVSCTSASFCMATGGDEEAFTYRDGTWEEPPMLVGLMAVGGVACVSETFCQAISYGDAYPFTGTSWGAGHEIVEFGLRGISCPATSFCMTVGAIGQVASYTNGTWNPAAMVDEHNDMSAVSCPSSSFCAAVDEEGNALVYSETPFVVGPPDRPVSTTLTSEGGSGNTPPPVVGPPDFGPKPPTPSARALDAALAHLLGLKAPTIAALLKAGGENLSFTAPSAGLLSVEWTTSGAHTASHQTKPVLIASASKSVAATGRSTIRLRLTAAGRKLLEHSRSLRLVETATFQPVGEPATRQASGIRLRRTHASRASAAAPSRAARTPSCRHTIGKFDPHEPCIVGNVYIECGYVLSTCEGVCGLEFRPCAWKRYLNCRVSQELGEMSYVDNNPEKGYIYKHPHKELRCKGEATILKVYMKTSDQTPYANQEVTGYSPHSLVLTLHGHYTGPGSSIIGAGVVVMVEQ
jgi:hypothetical protein